MASKQVEEIKRYENIERWCQDHVQNASDFLFDNEKFKRNLALASLRFDMEYEVRESCWIYQNRQLSVVCLRLNN